MLYYRDYMPSNKSGSYQYHSNKLIYTVEISINKSENENENEEWKTKNENNTNKMK